LTAFLTGRITPSPFGQLVKRLEEFGQIRHFNACPDEVACNVRVFFGNKEV
jgi:hypothetical protein